MKKAGDGPFFKNKNDFTKALGSILIKVGIVFLKMNLLTLHFQTSDTILNK